MKEIELETTAPVRPSVVWCIWLALTVIMGCLSVIWWAVS